MKKIAFFCLLCLMPASFACADSQDAERLLLQSPVPETPPFQGQVSLIRRDSSLVMQTVLDSKVLRQVLAAISKKERRAWPEDRDGWLDSRRYLDELFLAYETVQKRAKSRADSTDRHLKLMIEFVLGSRRSHVAFYLPTLRRDGDHLVVQEKELLKKMNVSRSYAYHNLLEIARDRFKLEDSDLLALMRPIPEES